MNINLHTLLANPNQQYLFIGYITNNILDAIAAGIEEVIAIQPEMAGRYRYIFTIYVEMLQNILRQKISAWQTDENARPAIQNIQQGFFLFGQIICNSDKAILRRPKTLPNCWKRQGGTGSKICFQIRGSNRYILRHFLAGCPAFRTAGRRAPSPASGTAFCRTAAACIGKDNFCIFHMLVTQLAIAHMDNRLEYRIIAILFGDHEIHIQHITFLGFIIRTGYIKTIRNQR